ncbi:MAG: GNAT family N-acetyltransferase [Bacteroidota bacterium]
MSASSGFSPSNKSFHTPLQKWFPIRNPLRPLLHKPAPELKVSDEILLKSLTSDMTEPLFNLIQRNRAYLQNWISWIETIQTYSDCKNFVHGVRYKDIFAGQWVYAILDKGELVGLLDFNEGEKDLRQISIGYWLDESAQGQGVVSQAVVTCVDYVFEELDLHRILIKCADQNQRSKAIPVRLGFTWEGVYHDAGTVNGKTVNMITYSMLYRDWASCKQKYQQNRTE